MSNANMNNEEYITLSDSLSLQRFREECLADRGYRFLRHDGNDTLWKLVGFGLSKHIVRVKPNGDAENEKLED